MPNPANRMEELKAAVAAVREASAICRTVQKELITADTLEKKDKSPVTVADFASQAIVCRRLAEDYANDEVVGEEDSADLRASEQGTLRRAVVERVAAQVGADADEAAVLAWIDRGGSTGSGSRYWTLDPIDGTKGFLRKEQYAVALGLIEDGEVVLGVLGCPNFVGKNGTGALFAAIKGMGARELPLEADHLDGDEIHVASITSASGAKFCESVESGHSNQDQSAAIAKQLGIESEPFRIDSQCKYAAVARNDASIYLRLPTRADYEEKIWDHAAGKLIVEEAGGRVTDINGKELDFRRGRTLSANSGVVATSGKIHDEVIAAIRAVGAS